MLICRNAEEVHGQRKNGTPSCRLQMSETVHSLVEVQRSLRTVLTWCCWHGHKLVSSNTVP